MKNFNSFNDNNKYSGKFSFNIFLDIIDELNNKFDKNYDYLNNNDFLFLFKTDKIKQYNKLLIRLKRFKSLIKTYNTLFELKDKYLSFYFAVKNYTLEYGFYDNLTNEIYKTGFFKITSSYLKTLKNNCILEIKFILNKINLKSMQQLQNIIPYYKKFLKGLGALKK